MSRFPGIFIAGLRWLISRVFTVFSRMRFFSFLFPIITSGHGPGVRLTHGRASGTPRVAEGALGECCLPVLLGGKVQQISYRKRKYECGCYRALLASRLQNAVHDILVAPSRPPR
ncbi:hypothetical protein HOY80DRAFT_967950 [Tuber brumale]|nr:hypothetical protein HOY80DRAFT_967950 [Tuber brumale]